MRIWLVLLLLGLQSFIPFRPAAQAGTEIEKVVVDIRPEYDRREVLVIYQISLSPQTALPAKVSLRIPAASGGPFAVAMRDNADLVNLAFTTLQEGDWMRVNLTTPVPELWIEYYDPNLRREGNKRSFEYRWPGDTTVQNLSIQVQQPVETTSMTFSPSLGAARAGTDGFTYFTSIVGKVDMGTSFVLKATYDKTSDALSAPSDPIESVGDIERDAVGRTSLNSVLPWILGFLGLLLILVGVWWYWQLSHEPVVEKRVRHAAGSKTIDKTKTSGAEGDPVYCHQCGKRAASGDVFCRACGTRLKVE